MTTLYASSLLVLAMVLATPAFAQTTDTAAPAPSDPLAEKIDQNGIQLGEVIVTAQRRSTDLQDTSAAISAFCGQALEDRVLSFEEVATRATSLIEQFLNEPFADPTVAAGHKRDAAFDLHVLFPKTAV